MIRWWFVVQDLGFRIQDSGLRIQDLRFRIQDLEFRTQDPGLRVQEEGMSLVQKGSSAKTIAANRANGSKAQGQHGVPGNAGRLQHGILAKVDPSIMRELGEDPAEYAQLREDMLESLAP